MKYYYPDSFDQITLSIIESKKLNIAALDVAENTVLAAAEALFQQPALHTLLDVGCGAGRLSIKFAEYFSHITALDPDESRLRIAKNNIEKKGIRHIDYIEQPLLQAKLPDEHFDVVLCNQIIQHIDTAMIEPMMQSIFSVLKNNGLLVLTTSYSNKNSDYFLKSFLNNDEVAGTLIGEQEFNRLTSNDQQILPVHYFSPASLKGHLTHFTEVNFTLFDNLYPDPLLDTMLFIGRK